MLITQHRVNKIKPFILIGIYVLMMLWLASCQKPEEDIQFPGDSEAFTTKSQLGEYVYGISLLDGSGDNIIDNASNLTVKYPVDVRVKGTPYEVQSSGDLDPIQQIYDLNPYVRDFMVIEFPIEVTRSDYSKFIINNQAELDEAITVSYTDQLIDDVECVDFNYPISLATYDVTNQIAKTLKIEDDQSLFNTLNGIGGNELINFNFPISVSVNGAPTVISNNAELQQVIEGELSACNENDRWYYSKDVVLANISLNLTDAPYPIDLIEEANVRIDRIDVKTGPANDSVPYITLFNDTLTIDLTELTNGLTTALGDVEIPVGEYDFFRVYVENGSVLLKDGRLFDLKVPSGSSSGIKIKPDSPIVIAEEGPNVFLFDFDLSRSFILKGNPKNINGFNFKPMIKVSNSIDTGVLQGRVTNMSNMPLDGVQISLFAADTINAITFSGSEGKYALLGLTPGDYILEAEKGGYEIVTGEIEIYKDQETTLDLIMPEL
ncbi:MAG: DUF4382 domain-containing protein [Bacteroidota bacterium]